MTSFARQHTLLGSPCPPVPIASTVDRRMELSKNSAVAGKVKVISVHTVLGLKVAGRALINIVVK